MNKYKSAIAGSLLLARGVIADSDEMRLVDLASERRLPLTVRYTELSPFVPNLQVFKLNVEHDDYQMCADITGYDNIVQYLNRGRF